IGVQLLGLVIVEQRAMQLVGSGLGGDADIAAAGAAVLGFESGGFDAELLHGIARGREAVHVADVIAPALFDRETVDADVPIVLLAAADLEVVPCAFTVGAL